MWMLQLAGSSAKMGMSPRKATPDTSAELMLVKTLVWSSCQTCGSAGRDGGDGKGCRQEEVSGGLQGKQGVRGLDIRKKYFTLGVVKP